MIDSTSGVQTLIASSTAERVFACSMNVNVIDASLPVQRFRRRCNVLGAILAGDGGDGGDGGDKGNFYHGLFM
jgi:hypothetical protein